MVANCNIQLGEAPFSPLILKGIPVIVEEAFTKN